VFGQRSQFLPFFDRFAAAAPKGVDRGELVMHEFEVDDRVIAINVCFQVAGRLSYYQSGRDTDERWRGAGMTLIAHAIEHGIDAGCRELDMLRGGEGYKRQFATKERRILRIDTTRGISGRVVAGLMAAYRAVRRH
jgi:CelD/BcsL family acetyltransferase involved in cellulose biosynthesis